jgi:hypothetical protein
LADIGIHQDDRGCAAKLLANSSEWRSARTMDALRAAQRDPRT